VGTRAYVLTCRNHPIDPIKAPRGIRALVPNAKIIFLSQETSAEVVEEALSTGARAYVQKAKAGSQLLAAIDAAISDGALH
jgi:DNA-binding NarL/FixJ family response regulator